METELLRQLTAKEMATMIVAAYEVAMDTGAEDVVNILDELLDSAGYSRNE